MVEQWEIGRRERVATWEGGSTTDAPHDLALPSLALARLRHH
jgi:hypothetical protein